MRLPEALNLGGVNVPTGTLLVANWNAFPDQIYAVNPTTGVVLSTLPLAINHDPVALTYNPTNNRLYLLSNEPNRIVEIDPTNGATVSTIDLSFDIQAGGLAVDPATGNFWVGTSASSTIVQLDPAGNQLATLDLAPQGLRPGILTGLHLEADQLFVSTTHGTVLQVDTDGVAPIAPVLAGLIAVAENGTPTNPALPSANGESVRLTGQRLTRGTAVLVPTPTAKVGSARRACCRRRSPPTGPGWRSCCRTWSKAVRCGWPTGPAAWRCRSCRCSWA